MWSSHQADEPEWFVNSPGLVWNGVHELARTVFRESTYDWTATSDETEMLQTYTAYPWFDPVGEVDIDVWDRGDRFVDLRMAASHTFDMPLDDGKGNWAVRVWNWVAGMNNTPYGKVFDGHLVELSEGLLMCLTTVPLRSLSVYDWTMATTVALRCCHLVYEGVNDHVFWDDEFDGVSQIFMPEVNGVQTYVPGLVSSKLTNGRHTFTVESAQVHSRLLWVPNLLGPPCEHPLSLRSEYDGVAIFDLESHTAWVTAPNATAQ